MGNETFFEKDIDATVLQFAKFIEPFGGNGKEWGRRLRELHAAGYLPLEIKALHEGTLVPVGIPVLTITNTLAQNCAPGTDGGYLRTVFLGGDAAVENDSLENMRDRLRMESGIDNQIV